MTRDSERQDSASPDAAREAADVPNRRNPTPGGESTARPGMGRRSVRGSHSWRRGAGCRGRMRAKPPLPSVGRFHARSSTYARAAIFITAADKRIRIASLTHAGTAS
ncbi:hypothetical protein DF141_16785 [Burkholderia cenocepacia]|nr:hypothetical protein DF141_16785 [Burkholderia cenocepacia]RQU87006.1 hypothetical protein DF133_21220 [Burkholderia cenocepacia]RQV24541.1 hypothetical protein DF132_12585 [Burkholderia cenocepacia]RQV67939.1 hypothetical protein DF018_17890 [Burkholderia cenocepacia]RQZ94972.1 hypothetical protein DF058_13345 [Burkholderia cenocepacia]